MSDPNDQRDAAPERDEQPTADRVSEDERDRRELAEEEVAAKLGDVA